MAIPAAVQADQKRRHRSAMAALFPSPCRPHTGADQGNYIRLKADIAEAEADLLIVRR